MHPQFNISRGAGRTQFVANDIATIHVEELQKEIFEERKLFPICLPDTDNQGQDYKIHAGWSTPPSRGYLQEYAPFYLQNYRDFSKLWHYNMETTLCRGNCQNKLVKHQSVSILFQFNVDTHAVQHFKPKLFLRSHR